MGGYSLAISHGKGRFVANDQVLSELVAGGQIATQYVDGTGAPSMDLDVNPNGSVMAIEGITSPDGRVFGKMGHVERRGAGLYKNVPGEKFMPIFETAGFGPERFHFRQSSRLRRNKNPVVHNTGKSEGCQPRSLIDSTLSAN